MFSLNNRQIGHRLYNWPFSNLEAHAFTQPDHLKRQNSQDNARRRTRHSMAEPRFSNLLLKYLWHLCRSLSFGVSLQKLPIFSAKLLGSFNWQAALKVRLENQATARGNGEIRSIWHSFSDNDFWQNVPPFAVVFNQKRVPGKLFYQQSVRKKQVDSLECVPSEPSERSEHVGLQTAGTIPRIHWLRPPLQNLKIQRLPCPNVWRKPETTVIRPHFVQTCGHQASK